MPNLGSLFQPCYTMGSVIFFCAINMFCLEMVVREAPQSGNLITAAQFFFVALQGFVTTAKFGTAQRHIPISRYAVLVILFFVVQTINNYALAYNIGALLHMILRSGSLIASLILNILIKGRSYSWTQHISVWIVTIGVVLSTWVSAPESKRVSGDPVDAAITAAALFTWLTGVGMLIFSLFLSSCMGLYQEGIYAEFGKHPHEALYYNHMMPLPLLLPFAGDIVTQIFLYNESIPYTVLGITLPWLWWLLIINTLSQFFCIRSVFVMTSRYPSLTVTLVVTLRKFISIVLSVIYFRNPFTALHWVGTALVLGGSLLYADALNHLAALWPFSKPHVHTD